MKEIWKDITGYEGYYQISNFGEVKSLSKTITRKNGVKVFMPEKILKQTLSNPGYYSLILSKDTIKKNFRVHRLIASAFLPNTNQKKEVNHINGIKTDNRIENLEWSTSSENKIHAFKTGLKKPSNLKGIKNGRCKLTEINVLQIRKSALSNKELSIIYCVTPELIGQIKNRKRWIHI